MGEDSTGHVGELLPAYVNGTLSATDQSLVAEHLATCAACRGELAEWMAVAAAAVEAAAEQVGPSAAVLAGAMLRIDAAETASAAQIAATTATTDARRNSVGDTMKRLSRAIPGGLRSFAAQEAVRFGGLAAASLLVTLLLVNDAGLRFVALIRDFVGTGYYTVGNYGYFDGSTGYTPYGLPCGPTTPTTGSGSAACATTGTPTSSPTPTATTASVSSTNTATPTATTVPTVAPSATVPTTTPTGGGGGGGGDTGSSSTTPAQPAQPAQPAVPAVPGVSPAQPAQPAQPAVPAVPGQTVTAPISPTGQVVVTLPGGQTVTIQIPASVLSALPPGLTLNLVVQAAPPIPAGDTARSGDSLGGGNTQKAGPLVDIQIVVTTTTGTAGPLPAGVGDTVVQISLPAIANPAGGLPPGQQARWLGEFREGGQFSGYLLLECSPGAGGGFNCGVPLSQVQGTLFLPAIISQAWVQNFDPNIHIFSGPTLNAIDFGPAAPQFTTFVVVAPQVGTRLFVFNPASGNYGWIDVAGVGPSGPPTP